MKPLFLLDEHFPRWWRRVLNSLCSEAQFVWIDGPGAPPLGTKDPELLNWCEANEVLLLTNNRGSMPRHLSDHNSQGRHVPGIFKVRPDTNIHQVVFDLQLIVTAAWPSEFRDRIVRLPL